MANVASEPRCHDDAHWPPGRQYVAVRNAIDEYWRSCETELPEVEGPGLELKSMPELKPARFVLISEWSAEESKYPGGSMVRSWVADERGLRSISREEYARLRPNEEMPVGYLNLRFHVCADGRHVCFTAAAGRRNLGGGRCWIDPSHPALRSTEAWA